MHQYQIDCYIIACHITRGVGIPRPFDNNTAEKSAASLDGDLYLGK